MKMILAIVHADDAQAVTKGLMQGGFFVTKLASTGGFLKAGTVTLLSGVTNERVDEALSIIKKSSKSKKVPFSKLSADVRENFQTGSPPPEEVVVSGASVFVLNVEHFDKY